MVNVDTVDRYESVDGIKKRRISQGCSLVHGQLDLVVFSVMVLAIELISYFQPDFIIICRESNAHTLRSGMFEEEDRSLFSCLLINVNSSLFFAGKVKRERRADAEKLKNLNIRLDCDAGIL